MIYNDAGLKATMELPATNGVSLVIGKTADKRSFLRAFLPLWIGGLVCYIAAAKLRSHNQPREWLVTGLQVAAPVLLAAGLALLVRRKIREQKARE